MITTCVLVNDTGAMAAARNAKLAAVQSPNDIAETLQRVPWMHALDVDARLAVATTARVARIAAGAALFDAGADADALYVVRFGLFAVNGRDGAALPVRIGVGETIGASGVLGGRARGATVRALRDSEVIAFDRATVDDWALSLPPLWHALAASVIARAEIPESERRGAGLRTLALLPADDAVDAATAARVIARALEAFGPVTLIDRALGAPMDPAALDALDAAAGFVVYVGDRGDRDWTETAIAHADALIHLLDDAAPGAPPPRLATAAPQAIARPEHLVVVGSARAGARPLAGRGARAQALRPSARVHHVESPACLARVARIAVGRSVNLVLSGGGARGFAHLGAIRALREAGLPIDVVTGSSIGAVIAAGVAHGWRDDEMAERYRAAFVDRRPLTDYTIPFVALLAGRRVTRLLREYFGEVDISDLALPFFCTGTDLTTARSVVFDSGTLWQRLRAAIAIPGLLPPVFEDGQVYVDGGVIDNLPVVATRARFPGKTIAVDIRTDYALAASFEEFALPSVFSMVRQWYRGERRPSLVRILLRAGTVNSEEAANAARAAADLVIAPELHDLDLLDWNAFPRAIDAGYAAAAAALGDRKPAGWACG